MRVGLFVIVCAALGGCVNLESLDGARQRAASGHVGCAPAEIAISDRTNNTWTASCKGRNFYCTAEPSAACKEAIK